MSDQETDHLDVLFPDREQVIQGETITVHEFSFMESLQLRAMAKPIIQDLTDLVDAEGDVTDEQALDVLATHSDAFAELVARACSKDVAWVRGLNGKDGSLIANLFWMVNQDFFTQRLLAELRSRQAKRSHGDTSSIS